MIKVPTYFFDIFYNTHRFPGCGSRTLEFGANCRLFAYELLECFGLHVPDMRSSELWEDRIHSHKVLLRDVCPLDLLLFNKESEAYGAHVAVYTGDQRAIHLAARENKAEIWPLERFRQDPRYSTFIGVKRIKPHRTR